MLKLFVTGDNHIGLKYASHPQKDVLIKARIDAFDNMLASANQEKCDLFVVTGDMFDKTYGIAKRDIKSVVSKLASFKGTVVVLPGNHDYYDADVKLWRDFEDIIADNDNILLLNEYRPYSVEAGENNVVLYPAFCQTEHSQPEENNLEWIKNTDITPGSVYHIGVAHGAVEGETIDNEGRYFPMKRKELEEIPVDVWLIGHTHVPFPRNLTEDSWLTGEKIFNAGTHVQTDVSCNTEGQCFIIEIDDNKTVKAKKFVSGNINFVRKNISVTAEKMNDNIVNRLADVPDNSVVDVILTGAVSLDEYAGRVTVVEKVLSRFIEGSFNDYGLTQLISKELIEKEFIETSFSANLLSSLLDQPKEAQLMYELLKSLQEGK